MRSFRGVSTAMAVTADGRSSTRDAISSWPSQRNTRVTDNLQQFREFVEAGGLVSYGIRRCCLPIGKLGDLCRAHSQG